MLPYLAAAALAAASSELILTMPCRAAKVFVDGRNLTLLEPSAEFGDFGYGLFWHECVHDGSGDV